MEKGISKPSELPVSSTIHSNLSIGQVFSTTSSIPMIDTRSGEITSQSVKESYHCPQCSFVTAWKSSLSIHLKTHTNERPWQCALCKKHFKLKHHLKHHILTHSSSKPFKCTLCNYKTADNRNMQRHKYNKHRTTFRRRGAERLSLPTMVPGSHANFDTNIMPFIDTGQNMPQSTSNTPLSTPSFQVPLSSPLFQSPTSMNLVGNSQMQWAQKSPEDLSHQSTANLVFSASSQINGPDNVNLHSSLIDHEKGSESLGISPPHNITLIKEELFGARAKRRSRTSERSFDMSQPDKTPGSPTLSTASADITVANVCSNNQRNYITIDSEGSDVAPPKQANESKAKKSSTKQVEAKWKCRHCEIVFPDNIMYGLHMGCHSVSSIYQCNICGTVCKDKHDFMFHFTIGNHVT